MLFHKDKNSRRQDGLENVLCFYFISKSSSGAYIIISPLSDDSFLFSFVCAPDFFKNKNTIETIQTNTILRAFIAKTFMARSIEFVRCVMKNYVTI